MSVNTHFYLLTKQFQLVILYYMTIFIQILGVVAATVAIIAFQAKEQKNILILKAIDSILFAVQWGLLREWTAMALTIVSIVRNLLMSHFAAKKINTLYLIIAFCIINIGLGIWTYQSWSNILKILATLITTISFGLKNITLVRVLTIPACAMAVVHASLPINFSIGGIITESFTIVSIIIALIRFRKKPEKVEDVPNSEYN